MNRLFTRGLALFLGAGAALILSGCVGVPYAGDNYVSDYDSYDGYAQPYYGAPAVVAPSVSLGIYGDTYDRGRVYGRPYPRGYDPRRRYYPGAVAVPAPEYGGWRGRPGFAGRPVRPERPGRAGRPDRPNRPGRPGPGLFPSPGVAPAAPLPVPGARVPRQEIPEAAKDPFGRNSGTGN